VGSKAFTISRCIASLKDLSNVNILLVKEITPSGLTNRKVLTWGAVMFPAAQAIKVMASVVDFLVCPATFLEIREKIRFPSAR
jgi:hypothetical protein